MGGSLYSSYKKAFWMGLLIPAIQQLTGINAILFYAPVVFEAQGNAKMPLTFITMLDNLCFTFVSLFVSDRLGRKILFIGGSIGCAIGLLLATICYQEAADENIAKAYTFDIAILFFIGAFGISHGPVW